MNKIYFIKRKSKLFLNTINSSIRPNAERGVDFENRSVLKDAVVESQCH